MAQALDWIGRKTARDGVFEQEFLGTSMGTRFGLPLAVALGGRLRCVVFGKFGLKQAAAMPEGLAVPGRVMRDARQVAAPALFHLQWDDEILPRDGRLAFFDALGSPDKQLIGFAGQHAETRPEAIELWCHFIARHLVREPVGEAVKATVRSR